MKRLLIIGAGGHGRAVAEAAMLGREYLPVAFLDDAVSPPAQIWGIPIWGSTEALATCHNGVDAMVVAIGRNELREALHARVRAASFSLATVVHPAAVVSPTAEVGAGCALMAGAIVGTQARLGEGVIVNSAAVVDHDCTVGPFGHLGVNASMAGGTTLGRGAWMQAGSSLGYLVVVPAWKVLRPGESWFR